MDKLNAEQLVNNKKSFQNESINPESMVQIKKLDDSL